MGKFWANHGTKLLGALVALFGAMGDYVELFRAFDPNPKHAALWTLISALGLAVLKRGFTNTATATAAADVPDAVQLPPSQKGESRLDFLLGVLTVTVVVILVACKSLGLPSTFSFDEQLASAYTAQTAVLTAATTATNSGTLTPDDALKVLSMAQTSRGFLDAARVAETAGNAAGASQELQLATSALSALQTYVNSHIPQGK